MGGATIDIGATGGGATVAAGACVNSSCAGAGVGAGVDAAAGSSTGWVMASGWVMSGEGVCGGAAGAAVAASGPAISIRSCARMPVAGGGGTPSLTMSRMRPSSSRLACSSACARSSPGTAPDSIWITSDSSS